MERSILAQRSGARLGTEESSTNAAAKILMYGIPYGRDVAGDMYCGW